MPDLAEQFPQDRGLVLKSKAVDLTIYRVCKLFNQDYQLAQKQKTLQAKLSENPDLQTKINKIEQYRQLVAYKETAASAVREALELLQTRGTSTSEAYTRMVELANNTLPRNALIRIVEAAVDNQDIVAALDAAFREKYQTKPATPAPVPVPEKPIAAEEDWAPPAAPAQES